MTAETQVTIQEFPYSDFGPNSVLIIKVPPVIKEKLEVFERFNKDLKNRIDESVIVVVLVSDLQGTAVELLDEKAMNVAGWFRRN